MLSGFELYPRRVPLRLGLSATVQSYYYCQHSLLMFQHLWISPGKFQIYWEMLIQLLNC